MKEFYKKTVEFLNTKSEYVCIYTLGVLAIFILFDELIFPSVIASFMILALHCLAVIMLSFLNGGIEIGIEDLLLAIGMFSFYFIKGESLFSSVLFCFRVVVIFIIGKELVRRCDISKVMYTFVVAYGVHGALEYISWILSKNSLVDILIWPSFFTGELTVSTHHNFYMIAVVCSIVYGCGLLLQKNKKGYLWLVLSNLYAGISMVAYGRSPFAILCVVLLICLSLYCNEIRVFETDIFKKNKGKMYIFCGIVSCLIIALLLIDVNNATTGIAFIDYNVHRDGGILKNVRFRLMLEQLKLLPSYPMGGCDVLLTESEFEWVHNSWLDIARRSGLIPYISLVLFGLISFSDLWKVWKNKNIDRAIKYWVIAVYLGFFLYNSIEPAIFARFTFWVSYVLMAGVVRGIAKCEI